MTRLTTRWAGFVMLASVALSVAPMATAAAPRVSLVEFVSVLRQDGSPVTGLTPDAFDVSSDTPAFRVEDVSPSTEPLTIALVVDATSSMDQIPSLELSPKVVDEVLLRRLGSRDRLRVFTVSPSPSVSASFTSDLAKLRADTRSALDGDRTGPSPIWDTIEFATETLASEKGQRVMLLATDGRTTGNRTGFEDVLQVVRVSGISVSVMAGAEPAQTAGVVMLPNRPLSQLASWTGGAFYVDRRAVPWGIPAAPVRTPAASTSPLDSHVIVARILTEWQHRYAVRFSTTEDGVFHAFRVSVSNPTWTVRARPQFVAR